MPRRKTLSYKYLLGFAGYLVILLMGMVAYGFPLYWMIRGSLITQAMWKLPEVVFFPKPGALTLDAFRTAFTQGNPPIWRVTLNSGIVAFCAMGLNVVFDCMAGFALSKMRLPGRRIFIVVLLITLMVPFQSMVVSLYIIVTRLGAGNTLTGILLPLSASAFSIILMWRFFNRVPDDVIEAALVDGAGWGTILFKVAIPLAAPAVATIAIVHFLAGWDAFFWPLLITDPNSRFDVLQKVIATATQTSMSGQTQTEYPFMMAISLIATLPIVVLFFFGQRFFIKGLTGGAVKG